MRKSRFSEEQIIHCQAGLRSNVTRGGILKEHQAGLGATVP